MPVGGPAREVATVDFGPVHTAALAVFGQDVLYTPAGGGSSSTVRGVFRSSHRELDVTTGAVISSNQPVIGVRLADLPNGTANRDDRVTVGGVGYSVIEVQRDGEGMATLRLVKKVP